MPVKNCVILFSARGCPFSCIFCHRLFGQENRQHSVSYILKFMKLHYDKGVRDFLFEDDIFNVPMSRGKEILSGIIKEMPKARLYFPNALRIDMIDDEYVELMERAGTVHIAVAIESAVPRIQKLIKKNLDLEKAEKYIDICSKKFITVIFCMIGFPTETRLEAMQTIDYVKKFTFALPTLAALRVYPNTEVYRMLSPDKEQSEKLRRQISQTYDTNIFLNSPFYGDYFADNAVPLKSKDIYWLKLYYVKDVYMNKDRVRNFNLMLKKLLSKEQIDKYCRNVYKNSGLSSSSEIFCEYFNKE